MIYGLETSNLDFLNSVFMQVHRLLQLFDSQRMRPEKPLLNNKARKRQFRDSTDRRLVMTAGERGMENTMF